VIDDLIKQHYIFVASRDWSLFMEGEGKEKIRGAV
jgi:hypothetical protein